MALSPGALNLGLLQPLPKRHIDCFNTFIFARSGAMRNNHQRVLADVISLDAWHDPFVIAQDTYGVYAEISFTEGRMGGDDPDIPFTFNVNLKKALLTIRLEEPLQIDRNTIARGVPNSSSEYTQVLRAKNEVKSHVGLKGRVTPALLSAALTGDVSKSNEVSKEEELRIAREIPEILVTARPEGPSGYSWELEPLLSNYLKGQPWNPSDIPRMRVKIPATTGINPTIRVEVRCALEDMEITSILPKSEEILERLKSLVAREINEAAAIQHLKKMLTDIDIIPGRMDNRFANILIADVLALSS